MDVAHDRGSRGRPDGAGAARGVAARPAARRGRASSSRSRGSTSPSRTAGRPTTASCTRRRARSPTHGLGLKAATVTPEGRDDVGSPNRILREEIGGKVIVRTGRRIPGVASARRRAFPDLGRPHGGRRRVRREGVARGRRRRRGRLPHRADRAADLPRGRGVRLPPGRADGRQGLRRAEVHGQPRLRGDAEGGDGRGRGAPSRTCRTSRS